VIRRTSRPDQDTPLPPAASHEVATNREELEPVIDWANLSAEDKQVFFSWLDEFFARHSSKALPPKSTSDTIAPAAPPVVSPRVLLSSPPPPPSLGPPPKINAQSRPPISSASSNSSISNDFVLSFPAPTTHGSAALDLAYYFDTSTHWNNAWYTNEQNPMPPPLEGMTQLTYTSSWQSYGDIRTLFAGTVFADLSVCWFTVKYSMSSNADPNDSSRVERSVQYLPRPRSMDKVALVDAHETYGETIAAFAESFDGTGEFCGRGECWDLASEALKYFDAYDYVPKPVPSISRTHGHLIFEGKAMGKSKMVGRWRGGDDRVRRGDIVEWRKVKINTVGASPYSWATLGDPDHTAVIVRDSQPSRQPADGKPLSPAELGSLEVVEQSVSAPPQRKDYDLSAFEEGEMWIYRPISMHAYLGTLPVPQCPPGVSALTL